MNDPRRETLSEAVKFLESSKMTPGEKNAVMKDFESGAQAIEELNFLSQRKTEIVGNITQANRELAELAADFPDRQLDFVRGGEVGKFDDPPFRVLQGMRKREEDLRRDVNTILNPALDKLEALIADQEKIIHTALASGKWMYEREERLKKFAGIHPDGSLGSFKRILGGRYVERE